MVKNDILWYLAQNLFIEHVTAIWEIVKIQGGAFGHTPQGPKRILGHIPPGFGCDQAPPGAIF